MNYQMHPQSVNDRFYVIKNPKNGLDAIWIHILWDEDTEEKIVWSSTLIPPISDQVRKMVENSIRQSDNEYYLHKNLEALKSDILSIEGIEDQFIPNEFIDSNGQAKILEYMPQFEHSWNIEDFLIPLENGKYNWGYHPDMDSLYAFFRGNFNKDQFKSLDHKRYTAMLGKANLIVDHLDWTKYHKDDELDSYLLFKGKKGDYYFHLYSSRLNSVVFFET